MLPWTNDTRAEANSKVKQQREGISTSILRFSSFLFLLSRGTKVPSAFAIISDLVLAYWILWSLLWKGKSCMLFKASVAEATSSNTTQAWPLCFKVLKARTSRIFPNWEKTARSDFLTVRTLELDLLVEVVDVDGDVRRGAVLLRGATADRRRHLAA
ncbi:Os05g0154850, partial [Oryza sativa Japonica Group]